MDSARAILLAIDTSDDCTGMAIISGGEISGYMSNSVSARRDSVLSEMQAELFKKCNIEYRDLSGVAVSMGPGSFTGLRVGVSYAKGICFALKIPLFGIDSLEALAHSAGFSERTIVPMIHARSDEIYIAAFKFIDGKLVRLLDNTLINFRDCGKFIKDKAVIIGSGSKKHLEALKNIFSDNFLEDRESLLPPVVSIAKYGNSAFMANKSVNLLNFEPKYLQIFPRSS